jgi:predicted ATPase/class 3 adenylate cyclase
VAELPSGTVTFLFTDIEGSTARWEQQPEAMRIALARHDALLRAAIREHDGYVVKTMGDAFHAAFSRAPDAVAAALDAQHRLQAEPWSDIGPLRVRMALHTGVAEERDGDYYGPPLNRAARLMSAGHGGQILLSEITAALARDALPPEVSLLDLGVHRLKDLSEPERVVQVVAPQVPAEFPPLHSLDVLPNNLPRQLTSFVGREQEMADVKRLLAATPLLTLVGTGGAGKTRLALQVAADVLETYRDGAWLVELAPLTDPSLVPQTVAATLGVREQAGRPVTQTLQEYLRTRMLLLVLDNCEHLVAACAALAEGLLRACPNLRIMATSREALGIAGETTWRVPSLSLPDPRQPGSGAAELAAVLPQYEAVRLFIDRALAVSPGFAVTNQNAPAVAEICHRLDGIPLAIELAAARIRVLTPEQIAARLDDRLRLLTGGSRTALPRQQTLRALVDWSYDLLAEQERRLLGRLSVFAGGWTLEAAEAVCAVEGIEDWEILDLLTQLVDKSIVIAERDGDATRYRLLETLRQYGAEKLTVNGEAGARQRAHADWYLQVAESVASDWWESSDMEARVARLTADHDNLRAALTWSLADHEEERIEIGLRIAASLGGFWFFGGRISESRRWYERVLGLDPAGGRPRDAGTSLPAPGGEPRYVAGSHPRVSALSSLANSAYMLADLESALVHAQEAEQLALLVGDRYGLAHALAEQGNNARQQGRLDASAALFEESLNIFRGVGSGWGTWRALSGLGETLTLLGKRQRAREILEESLAVARAVGHAWGVAQEHRKLGVLAFSEGDLVRAETSLSEALAIDRSLGASIGPNWALHPLGGVLLIRGAYARAMATYRECLALCQHLGNQLGIVQSIEGVAAVGVATSSHGSTLLGERSGRLLGGWVTAEGWWMRESTG